MLATKPSGVDSPEVASIRRPGKPAWTRQEFWIVSALVFWCVAVAAAVILERVYRTEIPLCMFKRLTGHPCPTCGSTRAVVCLAKGDPLGALAMNPLITSLLVAVPMYRLASRFLSRGGQSTLESSRHSRTIRVALWATALLALASNWAYVIWRGN